MSVSEDQVGRTNDLIDAFGSLNSASGSSNSSSGGYYTGASSSGGTFGGGAIGQLANGFGSSYHSYTANMVADRHAAEYNMRHKNRGMALIFNHENFEVPTLKSRAGTNVDCENLARVLKQLDFDVKVFKDCSLKQLKQHIEWASQQDHRDNDCILVAILSHGELGYIYAKDAQYKLDQIWSYFTPQHCPSLGGKPKLFFIQACQGDRLDPGVTMKRINRTETDGETSMSYKIPLHADFLIAYSTIPGFYSWRNTTRGSWFMQSLCAELAANGKRLDILTLLTFVCQRVAVDFESCTPDNPEMHQQKQIPCITTMLTRILRFGEKGALR
ncbi:PREDICTED: caspase [Bactrocera latifrons]|uniref:Caspase n=1 Tax=Bactrocera latifrons TaxID=174628 RepID=A0A0K8UDH0_BACLA|nr:PREDICTED: caspase [Bactrocera latifrons]